ncbi:uncharacterized protein LOC131329210 [Rhododendron vialii]|uniref:uncharacterized protein LOC131329210 n=1 Tax=Rhododendron vialii TaxID=182163 RepID=UPI00265FBBA5|nr:uncharacterized protein LOC131329210 [Rhododendron vialii]
MDDVREEADNIPPLTEQQPRMQCLDDINVFSPLASIPCESSANSSQILHTPQVKNDLIPKINQEFDNLDDVWKFYNHYGKEGGFGTRASSSKRNRDYGWEN